MRGIMRLGMCKDRGKAMDKDKGRCMRRRRRIRFYLALRRVCRRVGYQVVEMQVQDHLEFSTRIHIRQTPPAHTPAPRAGTVPPHIGRAHPTPTAPTLRTPRTHPRAG
jgi:hypothetical protein